MVFSSLTFLCVFLPVVLAVYYLLPTLRIRNILLIVVSLLFYAYGEPIYVLLMIFSIVMNYLFGRWLDSQNQTRRKAVLFLAVIINLGLLVIFKYTDMILQTINSISGSQIPLVGLALPIGISFFTFQALSYVIDVYRKEVPSQKNLWNVMLYISFFPQLIAGPIIRYKTIAKEINERKETWKDFSLGINRFIIGLGKKVLLANQFGVVADAVFNGVGLDGNTNTVLALWLGAISYTLQIFFDFAGYCGLLYHRTCTAAGTVFWVPLPVFGPGSGAGEHQPGDGERGRYRG